MMEKHCLPKSFTAHSDPLCDCYINGILRSISHDIYKEVRPLSIFSYGSVGRGEASAFVLCGKVVMLSDFEIGVVTKDVFKRHLLKRLESELSLKYNCDLTLSFMLPHRVLSGTASNLSFIDSNKTTIESYEISCSMYPLMGQDLRDMIHYASPETIPSWEGLRLLFNRMAEFLSLCFISDKKYLNKGLNKLKIACGDVLLVKMQRYDFSYRRRCDILKNSSLPKALSLCSSDIDFICSGYHSKLFPADDCFSDLYSEVDQLVRIVDIVLRWFVADDMKFKFDDYEDFRRRYLASELLTSEYFRGMSGCAVLQNSKLLLQRKVGVANICSSDFYSVPLVHQVYAAVPLVFFDTLSRYRSIRELDSFGQSVIAGYNSFVA